MNQLSNLNATQVKQIQYNSALQTSATTVFFTVYNCSVNCFVQQLIINLNTPFNGMGTSLNVSLLDRGNGYSGPINALYPTTFTTIGTSDAISPVSATSQVITQNGNTIVIDVLQSVQDSEGLGNIYIQMSLIGGFTFSVSFTMSVIYRPEVTYYKQLDQRNQLSFIKPYRVLSGPGSYNSNVLSTIMTDQTNFITKYAPDRGNLHNVTLSGFAITSANPYFYFGNSGPSKRWYINFSSDNQFTGGIATFSYFNGAGFVPFLSTQISNGCLGPGNYQFAYGGVVIFTPPSTMQALSMINDPYVQFNTIQCGLGTLASAYGNTLRGTSMYWIQCQVGFSVTNTGPFNISAIVPLIDPVQSLDTRRPLI